MVCRYLSAVVILLASCNTPSDNQQKTGPSHTVADSIPLNADTLIIDTKAAVFYEPDSARIEQEKKRDAVDFYTAADDNMHYMETSRKFLDSAKLSITNAKNKKYLKFVKQDNSNFLVKLDTLQTLWGVYLFDPAKQPVEADLTAIDVSYKEYFNP